MSQYYFSFYVEHFFQIRLRNFFYWKLLVPGPFGPTLSPFSFFLAFYSNKKCWKKSCSSSIHVERFYSVFVYLVFYNIYILEMCHCRQDLSRLNQSFILFEFLFELDAKPVTNYANSRIFFFNNTIPIWPFPLPLSLCLSKWVENVKDNNLIVGLNKVISVNMSFSVRVHFAKEILQSLQPLYIIYLHSIWNDL